MCDEDLERFFMNIMVLKTKSSLSLVCMLLKISVGSKCGGMKLAIYRAECIS
jgi:hypothetical protein